MGTRLSPTFHVKWGQMSCTINIRIAEVGLGTRLVEYIHVFVQALAIHHEVYMVDLQNILCNS